MPARLRAALGAWLRDSSAVRAWKYRDRYPGLSISSRAHADVAGKFTYGIDCVVGDNAIVYGTEGSVISFGDQVYVGRQVELGTTSLLKIGDNTSLQDRTLVVGTVSIGRYCLVSLNVLMSSGRHHYEHHPPMYIRDQDAAVLGQPDPPTVHDRPIVVDDDCWLGVNTVVLPGVHIGKGCVVGASSVVSGDLPPYSVAVGSPARIIKQRLDFKPPKQIRFDRVADWPYFYAGVGLADHERRLGANDGGLLVAGQFSLALDVRPGDRLVLEACSPQGVRSLRHGAQTARIETYYAPIQFSAEPDVSGQLAFDVESSSTRWPVRLRFAGLE